MIAIDKRIRSTEFKLVLGKGQSAVSLWRKGSLRAGIGAMVAYATDKTPWVVNLYADWNDRSWTWMKRQGRDWVKAHAA